jgi:5-methylthioadenosine/S-adenosylhomocysteine deaminase
MYDVLIQNTTVVNSVDNQATVLPEHDIAITSNKIVAVQPTGTLLPSAAKEMIDGTGTAALPGLINTHAHAAMVLFRGTAEDVPIEEWFNEYIWSMESNLTPDDVYWGAMLAMTEMIESGVTCVADHYFAMDQVAQAIETSGLRGHLAPTMFGQDSHAELSFASDFAARWHNAADGRIRAWLGPHAPYTCSRDFLREVAAEADRLQLPCHIHAAETQEQVKQSLSDHGMTPVQLLEQVGLMDGPLLCAHAAHLLPEDVDVLVEHGVGVAHCPKTFLKLAAGIAPVTELRRRGVAVGLGSDGAASNNTLDILEQMRLAAMLQKHEQHDARVLARGEALAMATADGARVLGQADVLGRLAPGFLADVILVRLDGAHVQPVHDVVAALVYAARAGDVDTLLVNGRPLMRHRQLLTLDKAEIVREVTARATRVRERAHGRRLQTYQ